MYCTPKRGAASFPARVKPTRPRAHARPLGPALQRRERVALAGAFAATNACRSPEAATVSFNNSGSQLDKAFAVNHLGPAMLSLLLLDKLTSSAAEARQASRIVNVSSRLVSHHREPAPRSSKAARAQSYLRPRPPLPLRPLQEKNADVGALLGGITTAGSAGGGGAAGDEAAYSMWMAYANSKQANLHFTYKLAGLLSAANHAEGADGSKAASDPPPPPPLHPPPW